jgi:ATP-binding cassette subfamily B protein
MPDAPFWQDATPRMHATHAFEIPIVMTTIALDSTPPSDPARGGLYRSLWRFAAGARLKLVAGITLLIGSQLLRLLVPWFAGRAIDALQAGGPGAALHAGEWIGALVGTAVATWGLHGPGRVLERAVGVRVRAAITEALFDRLAAAPLKWHDRHAASDLQQRMSQSSGALDEFAQNQYVILQGLVTFFGALFALVMFSPSTAVVAIVGYAVLVLVGLRFDRSMMRLADEENDASRRFSSGVLEFVSGIVTVAALRLERSTKRRLAARLDEIFRPLKRSIRLNEAKWCFVDLTSTVLTWSVVALYVWEAQHAGGAVLIGGIFMIYKYAEQAASVVTNAAGQFQSFARFRINYASADVIWDAPRRPETGASLDPDWNTIELQQVSYRHEARDAAVASDEGDAAVPAPAPKGIDRVRLTLRRGERVALVGPSGSGKSTLMRVMAGLYDAHHGHLTVDGVTHLHVRPLASVSTFIPQDADVFEASVLENIAPDGVPSDAAWDAALAASAFDGVLATLPRGVATQVAERGVNLSGGQRQRLGLARGILAAHGRSLILLDEPTSALDPLTEAHVYRELGRRFPDACIVASVHRMSALEHFDRVVLMVDGEVLGSGTIDELAVSQPLFAAMLRGAEESQDDREEPRVAA